MRNEIKKRPPKRSIWAGSIPDYRWTQLGQRAPDFEQVIFPPAPRRSRMGFPFGTTAAMQIFITGPFRSSFVGWCLLLAMMVSPFFVSHEKSVSVIYKYFFFFCKFICNFRINILQNPLPLYNTTLFFRRDIRRGCKSLEESPDTTWILWQITSAAPEYTWNREYGKYHRDDTSPEQSGWKVKSPLMSQGKGGLEHCLQCSSGKPYRVQEEWYSLHHMVIQGRWSEYTSLETTGDRSPR